MPPALVLVPLGIALAVRCIPPTLMQTFRETAARREGRPVSRIAAASVVALWIAAAVGLVTGWAGRA